jgi:hypothetical protein
MQMDSRDLTIDVVQGCVGCIGPHEILLQEDADDPCRLD